MKKSKFDFFSIRFKSWLYFIIFTVLIVSLIWFLQMFFIDHYYEEMKVKETQSTAQMLKTKYYANPDTFETEAISVAIKNDIFIRLDTEKTSFVYTPNNGGSSYYSYYTQLYRAKETLRASKLKTISTIIEDDSTGSKLLVYASYMTPNSPRNDDNILFVIAPLYPVASTISILRVQLFYITIISAILALILALYLSQKISIPINNITNSAVDLSKGNYNVKFEGGHFTELDALAKALNKASYEMQKTDFYQKDMIANVSHDLKTPLTMIRSYAELVQDISGNNPKKRNEHLQVIIDETNHLNSIVSDMLAMSRMQANTVTMNKVDFDLVEAANTVLATYHILAEQDCYTIEFNSPKSVYVNGDVSKIKQVMSNLITNAIKYCGEDKVIIVNIKRVGRRVRFDVIDHGAGIPEDELTHVWERYYKTSVNHARNAEGTGLGLSIVKGILTIHNAHYGVESKEGSGSNFWFELETVKAPSTKTLSQ